MTQISLSEVRQVMVGGEGDAGFSTAIKYAPHSFPGSSTGYKPGGWPTSFPLAKNLLPPLTGVLPEPEFGRKLRARAGGSAPESKPDITQTPSRLSVNPDQFTSVYMPIDTRGLTMADVRSRRMFLEPQIERWKNMHIAKVMTFVFAGAAVLLFGVNPILGALCGLGSGKMYGQWKTTEWYIQNRLRARTMMFTG